MDHGASLAIGAVGNYREPFGVVDPADQFLGEVWHHLVARKAANGGLVPPGGTADVACGVGRDPNHQGRSDPPSESTA